MNDKQTILTKINSLSTDGPLNLRNSYDLALLLVGALGLPLLVLLPVSVFRVGAGVALALLAPGYALTAILFPRPKEIDGVARAGLSFGLSVALLPVLALLLDLLPWGIQPWPIVLSLSLWILVCTALAGRRRSRLVGSDREFARPLSGTPQAWPPLRPPVLTGRALRGLVLAGALIGSAALLWTLIPTAAPTEFYVLGSTGLGQGYPRQASAGEVAMVTLGIVNHEARSVTYRLEVWVTDPRDTAQRVLARQEEAIVVVAGQKAEWPITWTTPDIAPNQGVEFLLFTGSNPQPYRRLKLWLNVVPVEEPNSS